MNHLTSIGTHMSKPDDSRDIRVKHYMLTSDVTEIAESDDANLARIVIGDRQVMLLAYEALRRRSHNILEYLYSRTK